VTPGILFRSWGGDKAVWPLIFSDVAGVVVLAGWLYHNNFTNPDSHVLPSHRKDPMYGDAEKTRRYLDHSPHNHGLEMAKRSETREVMGRLNKAEVEKRLAAKYY